MNAKIYKHLFFDLDHTLWDFDTNAKNSIGTLYHQLNLDTVTGIPFTDFYSVYLIQNKLLWARYEKGFLTSEELKWKRMWRTLLAFKIADEPLARKLSADFLEILPTQKEVFPHTFEILDYLTEKKYSLHLITNGFEKVQWSKLKHSGLDKYFHHVITSEASNSMKPKKEIFEFALRKTEAKLADSIMLGDNLEADIKGAMNAGMDSIFINHVEAECTIEPTHIVTHLKQLETIF